MTDWLLQISFWLLVAATLAGVYRLACGPSVLDRILAFDAVVMCSAGLVTLLSRIWETPLYLELILIIASLGFFGTVALVLYLEKTMPTDLAAEAETRQETDAHGESANAKGSRA
jgi:multisubunit Na+/H+ antiporter MnhF subunit